MTTYLSSHISSPKIWNNEIFWVLWWGSLSWLQQTKALKNKIKAMWEVSFIFIFIYLFILVMSWFWVPLCTRTYDLPNTTHTLLLVIWNFVGSLSIITIHWVTSVKNIFCYPHKLHKGLFFHKQTNLKILK